MKYLVFAITFLINVALFYVLGTREILPLPLGSFLNMQEGIWQNAEPLAEDFNENLKLKGIKGAVNVYLDDRLVPHIFAEHETDAYYVQGYLHAKNRLWQMEFQTHAAAGRISEIVGEKAITFDRNQRRIGMVYAAENALVAMENDPETKASLDAYTAGINAYINSLQKSKVPVEYKLLGYEPEQWSNLKSALFTKQMTNTLAGYDRDFEMTNAFKLLGEENFQILYGQLPDSLYPVIPNGTVYNKPLAELLPPETADSLYFKRKDSVAITEDFKPNPENGSNNWAVSGARTKSGQPILANDPHLGLTLPSIWYEIQIHTPNYNAYGVSFPGLPGVVIGFNDSIAFGFTNAGRDVKDYYEIQFKDQQKQQYLFNNQWVSTQRRIEKIKIKDAQTFMDTVAYTVFGPVTYDQSFKNALADNKAYALKWVAHDSSNILKMWLLLNRAHNLNDYVEAITYFNAPGQNMIFASKSGDIAIQQQATFPLRWKDQGLFVMPGFDSSYMWKGYIPMEDNPRSFNPVEGYVSSANQRPADSTYPYFIPGSYEVYRAITINRKLSSMYGITVDDMKSLQNDNYNVFAEMARPILLNYVNRAALDNDQKRFVSLIENWNLKNEPDEMAVVCFENWWDSLQTTVFKDELTFGQNSVLFPEKFVLLEALRRDTSFKFIDNINTPEREDLNTQVTIALKKASMQLRSLQSEDKLKWSKFKNTTVYHLLKNNAPSFARSGLMNGGGKGIVNATQHDHGPSWRMIVELTTPTIAYGIYPGGQSGNPGSRFYDDFIDDWTKGQYFKLFMMDPVDVKAGKFKWKMSINPA